MKEKNDINIWNSDLKNNSGGFKVPTHYLENFEQDILVKIRKEIAPEKPKKANKTSWLIMGMSIAAAMIFALFFMANQENSSSLQEFSELDWDQYATFEESWIIQELKSTDETVEEYEMDIDMLMYAGITNDEIMEAFTEFPNEE